MMNQIGRFLQIAGLILTGLAAVRGFYSEVSEGEFIMLGFGGLAVFLLGNWMRGGSS